MRTLEGFLALALVAALSGCSDDPAAKKPAEPSAPMSEITVDCDKFADTAKKINDAQTALYGGTGGQEAIDSLVTELDALKDGAPADVQEALTDMGNGFRSAAEIMENPTAENQAALAALTPKLADDGKKISDYIVDECS